MDSRYRWEIGNRSPSLAAAQAIAAFYDVDPTEMDDTLHNHVDPDALDTLIRDSGTVPVMVTISTGDYCIELRNDGSLDVREQTD